MFLDFIRTNYKPLLVYFLLIASIFVFLLLFQKYAITFAAVLFLSVPYLLGKGLRLGFEPRSFLMSLLISIIIIGSYLLLFHLITRKSIYLDALSLNLIIIHLIVIAFPEEAFFRGYLQRELGNDIRSIFIVSILFALGHFLTICIAHGSFGLHCITALLTFFPSLVMGYLYYKSQSIWGCTIFHFLSNLAYISTSGFSVFY
jgi:membrane protease YdiL (CAAX protease family)